MLLKRVKNAESNFLVGPEIRRIAEHVEQGFARFLVEFLCVWQLLNHNNKTRLRAGLVRQIGQAVTKCIKILAEMAGEMKSAGNDRQNLLLRHCLGAIGVQEVLAKTSSLFLQVADAEGADGLHNIWRHRFK